MSDKKQFIVPTKEMKDVVEENERLKILVNNMAQAYLVEMPVADLEKFLVIEVGFTKSEYDSYVKIY